MKISLKQKTVTYLGKKYECPDYTNFIVADPNGQVFVYEHKPMIYPHGFYYSEGFCECVGKISDYPLQLVDDNLPDLVTYVEDSQ